MIFCGSLSCNRQSSFVQALIAQTYFIALDQRATSSASLFISSSDTKIRLVLSIAYRATPQSDLRRHLPKKDFEHSPIMPDSINIPEQRIKINSAEIR